MIAVVEKTSAFSVWSPIAHEPLNYKVVSVLYDLGLSLKYATTNDCSWICNYCRTLIGVAYILPRLVFISANINLSVIGKILKMSLEVN